MDMAQQGHSTPCEGRRIAGDVWLCHKELPNHVNIGTQGTHAQAVL